MASSLTSLAPDQGDSGPSIAGKVTSYPSGPLREEHLRVLELLPGTGDQNLQCRLLEVQLSDDEVSYEALSYVWGDAATFACVECLVGSSQSKNLPVAHNLYHALLALRLADRPRKLWIDALCINQDDDQERSHQVAQMGRIFSQASRVLVWLGSADHRSTSCVEAVMILDVLLTEAARPDQSFEEVKVTLPPSWNWQLIDDFYSRPWFWRLWCVQELVLSKSSLLIWGDAAVNWDTVERVTSYLVGEGSSVARDTNLAGVHNAYLLQILRKPDPDAPPLSFMRLLSLTRQYDSSDPRDRIYSLLGFGSTMNDLRRTKISPDYSKTVSQVFTDAALAIIQQDKNLMLLSCVQSPGPNEQRDTPSWVPVWNQSSAITLTRFDAVARVQRPSTRYDALHVDGDLSLHCDGVQLDTVVDCMTINTEQSSLPAIQRLIQSSVEMVERAAKISGAADTDSEHSEARKNDPRLNYTDVADALYWALLGGRVHEERESADAEKEMQDFKKHLVRDEALAFSPDESEPHFGVPYLVRSLSSRCKRQALYVTRNGFVGLGPWCTSSGDVVCALTSAAMPMVMRAEGDHWRLLGETYMHPMSPLKESRDGRKRQELDEKARIIVQDLAKQSSGAHDGKGPPGFPASINNMSTEDFLPGIGKNPYSPGTPASAISEYTVANRGIPSVDSLYSEESIDPAKMTAKHIEKPFTIGKFTNWPANKIVQPPETVQVTPTSCTTASSQSMPMSKAVPDWERSPQAAPPPGAYHQHPQSPWPLKERKYIAATHNPLNKTIPGHFHVHGPDVTLGHEGNADVLAREVTTASMPKPLQTPIPAMSPMTIANVELGNSESVSRSKMQQLISNETSSKRLKVDNNDGKDIGAMTASQKRRTAQNRLAQARYRRRAHQEVSQRDQSVIEALTQPFFVAPINVQSHTGQKPEGAREPSTGALYQHALAFSGYTWQAFKIR